MADDDEATPAGWYRQPEDPTALRWWDGEDWTDDTMPAPVAAGRGARAAAPAAPEARPVLTFGDDAAPAVEIELEPVGGSGPAPRRSPVTPGAVARVARIGELEEDWSTGALPDGMGRHRRSPAARPGADRAGRPVRGASEPRRGNGAGRPPVRRPPPGRTAPGGRAPGHRAPGRPGPAAPGPSPESAAHLLRILVRAGLIALVVLVGWVGYSKLVEAEPGRARTLDKSAAPVDADEDAPPLGQVVLTLSDLPRGWSSLAAPTNAGICDGRIPETVIVPTATQSATFTQDDTQAVISSTIDDFPNVDTARAFMDLSARVIDSCRDSSANGTTTHLTPLEFPRFGDDTFAAALTSETAQGALRGDLVYLREGTRVATIASIQLTKEPVDEDLLQLLVGRVSNRLSMKARITGTLPSGQPTGEATLPGE